MKTDHTGDQDPSPLRDFSSRLDAARTARSARDEPRNEEGRALGQGFRLASELLAAALVGLGLGLGLDAVAGIAPFGLLAGLFLGFAAGLRNAVRAMSGGDGPKSPRDD